MVTRAWYTAVYNPSRRDGGRSASLAVTRAWHTAVYNPSGHTRLTHSRIQSQWSHAPGTQLYTIPVAETAAALLPWRSHAPGTQPYTIPVVTRAWHAAVYNPSGHTCLAHSCIQSQSPRRRQLCFPGGHTRLAHSRIQSQWSHAPDTQPYTIPVVTRAWHTAVYNPSRRDGGSSASLAVTRAWHTAVYNPSGHTRLAHSRIQFQWSHAPGTQLYTIPVVTRA